MPMQEFRGADRAAGDLSVLLSRTASSPAWLAFRPSLLAAGLLAALRNIKGILPVWPHALEVRTFAFAHLANCSSSVSCACMQLRVPYVCLSVSAVFACRH